MNKKLIYSLISVSLLLASCELEKNSSSNSINSDSISVATKYEKVDDVSNLFATYNSEDDYDFTATYHCDVIEGREAYEGWETTYMYDGKDTQISYESNSLHYVDYYIYDADNDEYIYYLDNGTQKSYQYLNIENNLDYYYQYVSLIDYFQLAGVNWTESMVYDLENHKAIPTSKETRQEVGKIIFGDNANEFWEKLEVTYDNGYISKVEAISILRDVVYMYEVILSYHGYSSVQVPDNAGEFVSPTEPHLKGKEDYDNNVALTEEQIAALTIFDSALDLNYTLNVEWKYAYMNGEAVDSTVADENIVNYEFKAANGNFEAKYIDTTYNVTNYFYSMATGETSNPIVYADTDYDNVYDAYTYEGDQTNYIAILQNIYLNVAFISKLDANDFTYNEEGGYITAKDAATEIELCEDIFFFTDTYGGLRIYLKDSEDGSSKVIDKIVTSMVVATTYNGATYYVSYLKTYNFSEIGTTTIDYPDSVKGSL